jgi:hypothetical protein
MLSFMAQSLFVFTQTKKKKQKRANRTVKTTHHSKFEMCICLTRIKTTTNGFVKKKDQLEHVYF